MPTEYHIGPGQTYDATDGWDTVRALIPTDFTAESDHHDVIFHSGYSYTSDGTKLTINNTTASKTLRIRCASGDEHLGDFSTGPELIHTASTATRWFYLTCDYLEIENLRFKDTNETVSARLFMDISNSDNIVLNNLMLETIRSVTGYFSFMFRITSCSIAMNNPIHYVPSNGTQTQMLDFQSTDITGVINNAIAYGTGNNNLNSCVIDINNFGALGPSDGTATSQLTSTTNATMRNCYTNGLSTNVGGTDKLVDTLATFKFKDSANGDFSLLYDSPLAKSGYDTSATNLLTINLVAWDGSPRTPFNGLVAFNSIIQAGLDKSHIYGSYLSGMVIADTFEAKSANFGTLKDMTLVSGGVSYGRHVYGYYLQMGNGSNEREYVIKSFDKRLTYFQIFSGVDTGVGYTSFGSTINFNISPQPPTEELDFTIGAFTGTLDYSSFIDQLEPFCLLVQIDLSKSTDDERVICYLMQRGRIHTSSFVCSGTAPSSLSASILDLMSCKNVWKNSCLYVWDRNLTEQEKMNLMYDPYRPYRDPGRFKFLRNLDVISPPLLWFLRKFVME